MDESSNSLPNDRPAASPGKSSTWPHGAPPLRLNRRAIVPVTTDAAPATGVAPALAAPPRFLWLRRLLLGVLLLAAAWGCLLLVAALGMNVWTGVPHQRASLRTLLYLLEAGAACWVGITAVGCIIAGAFCLTLAVTTRKW